MYRELAAVTQQLTGPGGPFEIHQIDVRGQRLRAYVNAPADMRQVWLSTRRFADREYLVYEDERLGYGEAHRIVAAVANALVERFGVRPGDRVAIAMRNYPEWPLAYWAIVAAGATVVGMNAWWTRPEMVYALEDSQPKVLIADQERLQHLVDAPPGVAGINTVRVRTEEWVESTGALSLAWPEITSGPATLPEVDIDPDGDACIFYTSGTTGVPKGAQLTHRGCTNNIMSMGFWNVAVPMAMQAAQPAAGAAVEPEPAREAERGGAAAPPAFLVCTPLFHVTACNCVMHGATMNGAKLVLMYKWDALRALELIQAERITNLSGVPVMSRELIAHPRFAEFDTSSLKSLGGGGAAIQPDLVEKIDTRVRSARPGTGYGMTEACGVITMNSADFFVDKPHSAGPLLPVFEGRIVDSAGTDLPPGHAGELWVRGAQVIRGYLGQPEATARTITDGWLHTGDIATIDEDGFVSIVDRAKDMVLRGGENVYCAEVEAAIFDHPAVAECCVFGVADDRLGEEVGAAVVASEGQTIDPGDLRGFLRDRIAAYKVPRYLWLRDEPLPRNASGKFLKRELRATLDPADAV